MSLVIQENIPLAPYTMYKIGGPARFFVEARNSDDLKEALTFAEKNKFFFFLLGSGSNVLISDRGFDGVAIWLSGGGVRVAGEKLSVDAGVMMARAVSESAKAGLAGFEWGIGIPGTVGGSVRGNAGCFGGEMKDVVESVEVLDAPNAALRTLGNSDCEFNYRDSIFKRHSKWVIVSATLALKKGDPHIIQENIKRITQERFQKQDIGTKSCGCIFKNVPWIHKEKLLTQFPELIKFQNMPNIPASYLIDASGLKGFRKRNVTVSEKHANYFVNEGGASAKEVLALITTVKDVVMQKFGIALEEEIQYIES